MPATPKPSNQQQQPSTRQTRTAIVTGASRGLGRALAEALVAEGWTVVGDARDADALRAAAHDLGPSFVPIVGDVADASHRRALVAAAGPHLDALVNNASALGPSPLRTFAETEPESFDAVLRTNVVAPLALVRDALPSLRAAGGIVCNISSDASVEAYATWGAYGASKAALDHASRILAEEEPGIRVHAVDPGDMRTAMHQDAFPGEDISDRPPPEASVPGLLDLLAGAEAPVRVRVSDVPTLERRETVA